MGSNELGKLHIYPFTDLHYEIIYGKVLRKMTIMKLDNLTRDYPTVFTMNPLCYFVWNFSLCQWP